MPDDLEAAVTDLGISPGMWGLDRDHCDCGGGYPCEHGSWYYAFTGPKRDVEAPLLTNTVSEVCELTQPDARLMAASRRLLLIALRAAPLDAEIHDQVERIKEWIAHGYDD